MISRLLRWKRNKFLKMVVTTTFVFATAAIVKLCYASEDKTFEEVVASLSEAKTFLEKISIKGINYDQKVKAELVGEKAAAIFIPNNEAFAAFAAADKDKIADPGTDEVKIRKLKRILKNHVILGAKAALTLESFMNNGAQGKIETASGDSIKIVSKELVESGSTKAKIILIVPFKSGYIYVVDKVLVPE